MNQINDEKIQITSENGQVVLRLDPAVRVWVDYGDSTICIETEDPMGALMDVSAAKRETSK